jgi:hypothetical protein
MNETLDIDLEPFREIRRHLRIAHHIPGRIRIRASAAVVDAAPDVDPSVLDRILDSIEGIEDVRVNKRAGSVVVSYRAGRIRPEWWETLVNGDEDESMALLRRLLSAELAPAVDAARRVRS